MKWAFVGDLQIPYQDNRAVALFFQVMKSWKPDAIDIVGDIDDQLEYSTFSDGTTDEFLARLTAKGKEYDKSVAAYEKALSLYEKSMAIYNQDMKKHADNLAENELNMVPWPKPPEKPVPPVSVKPVDLSPITMVKENASGAKKFYTDLRTQHKKADIHSSLGNHDIRIFKYMNKKAPEYLEHITPNTLWGLDDLGITWKEYSLPPHERFAGIHVHHGATTLSTGLAVRGDIETYNISLVRGHDHRGGVVYKTFPIPGQAIVGMGTGHLCDPSAYGLQYTINPSWELGFGIGQVHNDEAYLQFIPISKNYTCWVDGVLYEG